MGPAIGLSVPLLLLAIWGTHTHLTTLRQSALVSAYDTLTAVADLKAAQVRNWRRERLADAAVIAGTPYAVRRAMDCLADPDSGTTRKMFTGWLERLLEGGTYGRAILVDEDGGDLSPAYLGEDWSQIRCRNGALRPQSGSCGLGRAFRSRHVIP